MSRPTIAGKETHCNYSDAITPFGPYPFSRQRSNVDQTEILTPHKSCTKQHTYEYPISKIINGNYLESDKIKFYFTGLSRGYNIGYTVATRDITTEIEEMDDMLDISQIRDVFREELGGGNKPIGERLSTLEAKAEHIEKGIDEINRTLQTNTGSLTKIDITLGRLDERLKGIEGQNHDKEEKLKAWLPAIFAGACTLIAALIAFFHP